MTQNQNTLDQPHSAYATVADPELQRHHWQSLFVFISTIRPEWPIDQIAFTIFRCRNLQTFPDLVRIAVRVAGSPRFNVPSAIGMAAAGLIEL